MIASWLVGLAMAGPYAEVCGPDPLLAVYEGYEMLVLGAHPAEQLYFARCLGEAGFPAVAQLNYFDVVHGAAEGSPERADALHGAMELVDELGDAAGARVYLGPIRPKDASDGPGRDALYYLLGRNQAEQGSPLVAALWLEEVGRESRWYGPARLVRAQALEEGGQLALALEGYAALPDDSPEGPEALARRALLLAGLKRTDEALEVIERLVDTGEMVGLALGVEARIRLERQELTEARRAAKAAMRAGRRGEYAPDAELVLAEIEHADCRTGAARRHARRHLERSEPVRIALDTAVNVGRVDGERIVEVWTGEDPLTWGLPEPVLHQVLDHPERAEIEAHLAQLQAELDQVRGIEDARFQAVLAPVLDQAIASASRDLREVLGRKIAEKMRTMKEDHELRRHRARQILAAPACR